MRAFPPLDRWLAVALTAALIASSSACVAKDKVLEQPFQDDFERAEPGADWRNTGAEYRIDNGALRIEGARNHPLWLRYRLPRDVVVELDCWSDSPDGDIKVELFGDGVSYATQDSYTATSYVFIFGGWKNTSSIIARMDEHGGDTQERRDMRVQQGKRYHWKITRKGNTIDWEIDGKPFLRYTDTNPLEGRGHEYFAFNNWDTQLGFDNLKITPLK